MPIYLHLNARGAVNLPRITSLLERKWNIFSANLDKLKTHSTKVIEVAYPAKSRFNPELKLSTGIDDELAQLGVSLIHWEEDKKKVKKEEDNNIVFTHGTVHGLQGLKDEMRQCHIIRKIKEGKGVNDPALKTDLQEEASYRGKDSINEIYNDYQKRDLPLALLHVIQTLYFPGMPQDTLDDLENRFPVRVKVTASGGASARGIAATGNLGALMLLKMFSRIFGAAISILNGGLGTRLSGIRRLKGDVLFGRNNLTIQNIRTALYFQSQMPKVKGYEYRVMLANDGILVPFGMLTSNGEILSKITDENKAKECYFFAMPDDPAMPEEETRRFGMIALRRDGSFICTTEKLGRKGTLEKAKEILSKEFSVDEEEIRLYVNYFGMASTQKIEKDLWKVLKTLVRPNLTADEIGDLDTFSLLFAAMSSESPEEFRKATANLPLTKIFVETVTDKILYKRLTEALFVDGDRKKPRFGFAEFNREGIAIDIGTLPSLFGFYLDLVRNFALSGETRDKLIGYLRIMERGGKLTSVQEKEVKEAEEILRNQERVTRYTTQLIARLNPDQNIESCEFTPDPPEHLIPIIGVSTDDYVLLKELQEVNPSKDIIREFEKLLSAKRKKPVKLKECKDKKGGLLFLYDSEGINTVKLVNSRIKPGAIIGRNTVVFNSEVGNGSDNVIIAENGAVVASKVTASFAHKPLKRIEELDLIKNLKTVIEQGKGSYPWELPNGWNAILTLEGTNQSKEFLGQIEQKGKELSEEENRQLPDLREFIGEVGGKEVALDLNDGVGRIQFSQPGINLNASDPSKIYRFSLRYERREQPMYIVYGRSQDNPVVVDNNMAYFSRQPVANAPVKDYEVPFDADPAKTYLSLAGGIKFTPKDAQMQEEFGYYSRFRFRTNKELLEKAKDMATAVEDLIQQLPVIVDVPWGKILPQIKKDEMERAIQTEINKEKDENLKVAVIEELWEQTPYILSQYLAGIEDIKRTPDQIAEEITKLMTGVNRKNRRTLDELYNALGVTDPEIKRKIQDVVVKYPFSQRIFKEYQITVESFSYVIEALIEQFRIEEVSIFEPKVEELTKRKVKAKEENGLAVLEEKENALIIDFKMDKDCKPMLPDPEEKYAATLQPDGKTVKLIKIDIIR